MEEEAASKETSKDVNATGDADVNALFQTLYAGATDEQRRAMVKSYQESNGTALSTDWDTVKVVRCSLFDFSSVALSLPLVRAIHQQSHAREKRRQ